MNRYGRGASKATPTTLCQKCLKRGHFSYECKAAAQERPYAARPSRTQQMLNPRLAPKLTNAAPQEPPSQKSISQRQPDQDIDDERRNPGQHEDRHHAALSRKRSRSRSVSSHSTASVDSISTRSSRPPSPHLQSHQDSGREKRRRRASSISSSPRSEARTSLSDPKRHTRLRRRSTSPAERGRRRSRSSSSDEKRNAPSTMEGPDSYDRAASRRSDFEEGESSLSVQRGQFVDGRRDTNNSYAANNASRPRQGSLSPYSKRIALTRENR